MSKREFKNTQVSANTLVRIGYDEYPLFSVDYQSGLIQVKGREDTLEVPYKYCEFVNGEKKHE